MDPAFPPKGGPTCTSSGVVRSFNLTHAAQLTHPIPRTCLDQLVFVNYGDGNSSPSSFRGPGDEANVIQVNEKSFDLKEGI